MYNDILNSKIEVNEKLAKIDRKDYDIYRTVYYNRVKNGEVERFKFSDVDVNNFKEDNSGASISIHKRWCVCEERLFSITLS